MKYGYVCRRPTSRRHRCVTLPGCIRPRSRQRHCRFLRHVAQLHARGGSLHCLRERVFAALRGGKVRPHACVAKISALLLGSDRPKTLSLRNPRRSVSVGREAVCFLHKFAKACDPDFVSVPVLEYLVYCIVHGRGSFQHGRKGQGYRVVMPPLPQPRTRIIRRENASSNSASIRFIGRLAAAS